MAANPDEHIPDSDETHRLAIVDLDWDKIRAVDLLAVLRSFLGKGQTIRGVTVYPSDFGLQKMKEEAAVGPQVGCTPHTLSCLCTLPMHAVWALLLCILFRLVYPSHCELFMYSVCACCLAIGAVHAVHALNLCMLFRQASVLCMLLVHCFCAYCLRTVYIVTSLLMLSMSGVVGALKRICF